ncbi:hypothetical protein RchiOBHm_Chr6g0307871 [Rosa chinensis]|uniref:Uncharacterized protein n=1 Tax=Rosa chinensis TaxID=74649 RepID=A0A2P6Q0F7_ROSCH|nr:hypothetical protein RchiOBHm_Chr6g0307871 [Rosa chinensis]
MTITFNSVMLFWVCRSIPTRVIIMVVGWRGFWGNHFFCNFDILHSKKVERSNTSVSTIQ